MGVSAEVLYNFDEGLRVKWTQPWTGRKWDVSMSGNGGDVRWFHEPHLRLIWDIVHAGINHDLAMRRIGILLCLDVMVPMLLIHTALVPVTILCNGWRATFTRLGRDCMKYFRMWGNLWRGLFDEHRL